MNATSIGVRNKRVFTSLILAYEKGKETLLASSL